MVANIRVLDIYYRKSREEDRGYVTENDSGGRGLKKKERKKENKRMEGEEKTLPPDSTLKCLSYFV